MSKGRAVLTAVKDAARRLRRWPAAILDRRCARRDREIWPGTEKRPCAEPRNELWVVLGGGTQDFRRFALDQSY